VQNLDRDEPIDVRISREIERAHAAAADSVDDLVPSDVLWVHDRAAYSITQPTDE
jgi:hypothetical protein